jgi:hypothetical protein
MDGDSVRGSMHSTFQTGYPCNGYPVWKVEPNEAATGLGRVLPVGVALVEADYLTLILGERD